MPNLLLCRDGRILTFPPCSLEQGIRARGCSTHTPRARAVTIASDLRICQKREDVSGTWSLCTFRSRQRSHWVDEPISISQGTCSRRYYDYYLPRAIVSIAAEGIPDIRKVLRSCVRRSGRLPPRQDLPEEMSRQSAHQCRNLGPSSW